MTNIYINDDPGLTLTYFTTMSNLAKLGLNTYSRPRYQVSVNRTIGPLVSKTNRKLSVALFFKIKYVNVTYYGDF